MRSVLALVVVAMVLAVGCLGGSEQPRTYSITLPHAKEVVVVRDVKFSTKDEAVVDFNSFKELADEIVYVEATTINVYLVDPLEDIRLKFYTVKNGMLWVSYLELEKVPRAYELVVENNTIIIKEGSQ